MVFNKKSEVRSQIATLSDRCAVRYAKLAAMNHIPKK